MGLLIDRINDQYPIISGSFPDTLLQDVGKLSDMGVHTDISVIAGAAFAGVQNRYQI